MFRPTLALFTRSLKEETRHIGPYLIRAGLVVIVGLFLWEMQDSYRMATGAAGRDVFEMITMWNLAFLSLAGLVFFSTSITEEKEEGTMPLLRMTKLSAFSILLGKSASRLFSASLLVITQIPITLLAVALGGISLSQIGMVSLILLAFVIMLNGIATFSSVIFQKGFSAIAFTLLLLIVLGAGPPLLQELTDSLLNHRTINMETASLLSLIAESGRALNPVISCGQVFASIGGVTLISYEFMWYSLGVGFLGYIGSWLLWEVFNGAEKTAGGAESRGAGKRKPSVDSPRGRVPAGGALFWKEFHYHYRGWTGLLINGGILALIITLWCVAVDYMDPDHFYNNYRYDYRTGMSIANDSFRWDRLGEMMMVFAGGWGVVQLIVTTSRSLSMEVANQTLSALCVSPYSAKSVYGVKIAGIAVAVLPSLCLFLLGSLFALDDWDNALDEADFWLALIWFATFVFGVGLLNMFYSLFLRWGAFLATGGTIFICGFLTVIVVESARMYSEEPLFVFLTIVNLVAAAFLAKMTIATLEKKAAAE
jgi:hypothetical protein